MSWRRACRCGEPLPSGIGGISPHGEVAHLPLLALGELVEAEDACILLALARDGLDDLLGGHRRQIIVPPVELRKWPRKNDPESIKARQAALDGRVDTRGLRARPDAVGQRAGGAHRRLGHADRGDRAADDLARRVRADRAGGRARRARAHDGRGLRAARAHRGLALGLALPRRAGGGRVRRLPHRGAARPDDARLRVRHELDRGGRGARPLDRGRAAEDARLARRSATRSGSRATRSCARSRRTSPGRSATSCGPSRPAMPAGRT